MRKKSTLLILLIAFLFTCIAQPQWQNYPTFNCGNKDSEKRGDWFEPDTIYLHSTTGFKNRKIYTYENGALTHINTQRWEWETWADNEKEFFTYDLHNNLSTYLRQYWKEGRLYQKKITYTYDSRNNITEELYSEYFYSNPDFQGWAYTERIFYIYDSQNNMIEKLLQIGYGYETPQWENYGKFNFTYDANNNMIEELYYWWAYWNNWSLLFKTTFKYDTNKNLTEKLKIVSWGGESWVNYSKNSYSYNSQNKIIEEIEQNNWDDELNLWYISQKKSYTYDVNNNNTGILIQGKWQEEPWSDGGKYTFTYNLQNNMTEELYQSKEYGEWENRYKNNYTYDKNNSKSGIYQSWDKNEWINSETYYGIVWYNNMKSSLHIKEYYHKFTATYTKTGTTSIPENTNSNNSLKLFPNPVSNILHIEMENNPAASEIKIYSIQGALVLQNTGNQIDVSTLPAGIYVADVNGSRSKIIKHN